MGHGLGASHGVAYVAWQKQIHAGKSQVQRVEQPDGARVTASADLRWLYPITTLRCVGPLYERAGDGIRTHLTTVFPTACLSQSRTCPSGVTVAPCRTYSLVLDQVHPYYSWRWECLQCLLRAARHPVLSYLPSEEREGKQMYMGRLGFDRGAGSSPSYLSPSLPHTHACWASIWVCLPREESSTRSVSVLIHLTTRGGPLLSLN